MRPNLLHIPADLSVSFRQTENETPADVHAWIKAIPAYCPKTGRKFVYHYYTTRMKKAAVIHVVRSWFQKPEGVE